MLFYANSTLIKVIPPRKKVEVARYNTGDLALYDRRWAGVVLCQTAGDVVEDCHNKKIRGFIDSARQLTVLGRPTVVSFFKTFNNVRERIIQEQRPAPNDRKAVEFVVKSVLKDFHCKPASNSLLETIFREAASMQRFTRDEFAIVHYLLFGCLP